MNDTRYAPPSTTVSEAERARPGRPRSVVNGVRLLWVSAFCALPGAIFDLVVPPADVSPGENVLINIGGLALGLGIAWVLNTATWRGRNWGRIINLVLAILGAVATLSVLYLMSKVKTGPSYLATYALPWNVVTQYVVQSTLSAVALAFLFTRSANAWFKQMEEA